MQTLDFLEFCQKAMKILETPRQCGHFAMQLPDLLETSVKIP